MKRFYLRKPGAGTDLELFRGSAFSRVALPLFCAAFAVAYLTPTRAFADGGQGGGSNTGGVGGLGGSGYQGAAGNAGSYDNGEGSGGGGGAAGGGAGGAGGTAESAYSTAGAGGAGGTAASPDGQAGAEPSGEDYWAGGGGGGGGYNGNGSGTATLDNGGALAGGNGGDGGDSGPAYPTSSGGGGGGGGGGGYGAVVLGGAAENEGSIVGGAGGAGGSGGYSDGGVGGDGGVGLYLLSTAAVLNSGVISGGSGGGGGSSYGEGEWNGGDGGSGGVGVAFVAGGVLDNTGTISGGNGGSGGGNGGVAEVGGAGVVGSGLQITDAGGINAGWSGDGSTQADAIDFTGGVNSLTLEQGYSISGTVSAYSGSDALILGGSGSGSFSVSSTGAAGSGVQYQGFGVFEKTGSSTWTLTGSNSGVTSWTIEGGVLNVSSDAALGSVSDGLTLDGGTLQWGASFNSTRDITLGPAGGTFDTNDHNAVLSGSILGGALTKVGAGALVLDGEGLVNGAAIEGGTLEIGDSGNPGAVLVSAVAVDSGGTLAGDGIILGSVSNGAGGIVVPGAVNGVGTQGQSQGPNTQYSSIGTLSVLGAYTQASGGTLQIEVEPGQASKLSVIGPAALDGTLALIYAPGDYTAQTYTLLSAEGGVSGAFASVTSSGSVPSADFSQSVWYGADDVDLTLTQVVPTEDTVYSALDNEALLNAQQANRAFLDRLDGLDPAGGSGSSDAGLATELASAAPVEAFDGSAEGEGMERLLPLLPDEVDKLGGWFRATGSSDNLSASGSEPGFYAQSGGFLAGFDHRLAEEFVGGVSLGYSQSALSVGDGETGTLSTQRVVVYGSSAWGWVRLDGTLGYAYDALSTSRPISAMDETAVADFSGQEATGALQASLPLNCEGVTVQPQVGVDYAHLSQGAADENGAGAFDLDVAEQDDNSLKPFVGIGAARSFSIGGLKLIPEADLGWSYETLDLNSTNTVSVGGGTFTVDGVTPARSQVTAGGGLSAKLSERLALVGDYQAILPTGNLWEQELSAGLRCEF